MMEKPEEVVIRFKAIVEVGERDEVWKTFDNRSLAQHHALIEPYALHPGVPALVTQSFENARNTWLYSFFNFSLLKVAHQQVHLAGELAIKERARLSGVDTKTKTLKNLLEMVIAENWLLGKDSGVPANQLKRVPEHREMLRYFRIPFDPDAKTIPEQDYAKNLVEAFRQIRNDLPHDTAQLNHSLSWEFSAIRDLINQLFPQSAAKQLV
jgi:hypothetical protein